MADNALLSSFMMLSERLYSIFVQYIINGRTRAPPETDLMEMLPTFQFGAKTDRRALQSKFKSWAKRMNFENGYLTLINSGKIIIPKERCDELIMYLHSEDHCNIEKIISQIRATYSWTKKNFGMDRDVVVESIARNCRKEDCLKNMRLEIARLSSSFCSNLSNPEIPETDFKMPSEIQCIPPYSYRWPYPFPVGPMFTPNAFPFQSSFWNNIYNMRNAAIGYNKTMNVSVMDRKCPLNSMDDDQKNDTKSEEGTSLSSETFPSITLYSENKPKVFKKPKNEYEYKDLMEAVKLKPNEFPSILKSEKTKFLAHLGIAPKSICSSRTLKRFRQELRRKKLMNRECMIYRERKILRDKNKLKKYSHDRKIHSYLEISSLKDSVPTRLAKSSSDAKHKDSPYLKLSRNVDSGEREECSTRKRIKITNLMKEEPIEIIDIATSEDEAQEESFSSNKENKEGKEKCGINAEENQPERNENEKLAENTKKKLFDTQDYMLNAEEDKENLLKHKSEENIQYPLNVISQTSPPPVVSSETHKTPLIPKRILLPKTINDNTSQINNVNFSNVPFQVRRFPSPHIVGSYAGHRNLTTAHPTNYLFPRINPVAVSVQQRTPGFLQHRPNFVLSNQNNVPRIVYPIQVPKTKGSKIFLVNNTPKGFYIIPQYHRRILPRDPQKTETPVASNSQETKVSNSLHGPVMSEKAAAKQSNQSSGTLIKNGEKDKIDINEEMMRISKWIYRMKANLNPCMFKCGIEKSVQNLISQLDVGIYLVREAKRSLADLENCTDVRNPSSATAK